MQELPDVIGNSGDGGGSAPAQQQPAFPVGGGGGDGGFTDDGDRNSGGNRWLRQETLALIKIRSDMDATFRDSNLKSPLWDEVSRKLSELGFHRNPMKCKEKFENVYKYNKRTKEGRTSKSEGKTYRFFNQLQALEANAGDTHPSPPLVTMKPQSVFVAMSNNNATTTITTTTHTVPSVISDFNVTGSHQNPSPISVAAPAVVVMPPLPVMNQKRTFPFLQPNGSGSTNSASSSYISSDDQERPKKKRKWKDFFGKLMKEVIEKQEKLQMKFLDTLERRDRDRVAREEAWRMQEIARVNREHELLARERSIASVKDTAVITFLQKITGENPNPALHISKQQEEQQQQKIQQPLAVAPKPPPSPHKPVAVPVVSPPVVAENSGDNMLSPSPSRWPKAEINALISLRTSLDMNYQENGPKGPLWEEISTAMKKLGYNRSAKRCKEKWENINKYYKKVKDGSKKRSENSKTCPYFDQLDDIYRQKANNNRETQLTSIEAQPGQQWPPPTVIKPSADTISMDNKGNNNLGFSIKHETQIAPIIARPEQQWPPHTAVVQEKQQQLSMADMEENDDDYEDDDEEDDGDGYEIVPNKVSSLAAV